MLTLIALLACNPAPPKPVVEPIQVQPGVTCYVAVSGSTAVGLSCLGLPQPVPPQPVPPPPVPPVTGEAAATEAAASTTEEKKAE